MNGSQPTDSDLEFLKIRAEQSGYDDGAEAIECVLKAEEHVEQADELIAEVEDLRAEADVLKEHLRTPEHLTTLEEKYSLMMEKLDAAKVHNEKSQELREQATEVLETNSD